MSEPEPPHHFDETDRGATRVWQFLNEYLRRLAQEDPSAITHTWAGITRSPLPPDLLEMFAAWLRARYPVEAEAVLVQLWAETTAVAGVDEPPPWPPAAA